MQSIGLECLLIKIGWLELTTPFHTGIQRSGLLAIIPAFVCLVAFFLTVDQTLLAWIFARGYVFAVTVLPGLLLALACMGGGDMILRVGSRAGPVARAQSSPLQWLTHSERILLSFACGIGVLSCGAFLLGITGVMGYLTSMVLLFAGLLCGVPLWKHIVLKCVSNLKLPDTAISRAPAVLTYPAIFVTAMLVVVVGLMMAVSLAPPIIFDVTEYHLGAWTDYFDQVAGTVHFVPMAHNFYARFPFPVESLYFLGLSAAPYTDAAPKVFNVVCVIFCGLLAACMAGRLGAGRTGSCIAALVTLAHPVMFDVSIDALIDAPAALLVASGVFVAFLGAGLFRSDSEADSMKSSGHAPTLIVASFFLFGTALAAKYTVAQIYLLPWVVFVFPLLLRDNWRRRPGMIFFALLLAVIPCILWLGKNIVWYGNPLEPFFVRWFRPADHVAIAQEKFYIDSHFPQSPLSAGYWATLVPRLREFQVLILAACIGWMFRSSRGAAIRVLGFAAFAWLGWNTVRDSQNRFLLPAMVLLAPVATVGAQSFPTVLTRRLVAALLVLFALAQTVKYSLTIHESALSDYLLNFAPTTRRSPAGGQEPNAREAFYTKNLGHLGEIINESNRSNSEEYKMLLVYEARPYLFRRETLYNVVWDDSVLLNIIRPATSVAQAWALLRQAGISHVLVNRQELLRYIQQYARPEQLRGLGVEAKDDPRQAWSATNHPEDLYPPFYHDRDWARLRPVIHILLKELDAKATTRKGLRAAYPEVQPLDIIVTPL